MHWLACGEHRLPPDDAWLAPAEAARLARYRFTKRRTEYRLRRWAGKHAVAAVTGLGTAPEVLASIEVLNRPDGAPYVRVDGEPLAVDLSLTDRAGWAVCLVRPGATAGTGEAAGSVGVDLELVEPRSPGFVADFLTVAERDHVRSLPDGWQRHVAANLMWSAKESALKVLRTGLRADTRSVEVRLDGAVRSDGWGALEVRAGSGRSFPGWWRRDGAFVLTVAHDGDDGHGAAAGQDGHAGPPELLAGAGDDLATAVPLHSWLAAPSPP